MGSVEPPPAPARVRAGWAVVLIGLVVAGVLAGLGAFVRRTVGHAEQRAERIEAERSAGRRFGRTGRFDGCIETALGQLRACEGDPLTCRGAAQGFVEACVGSLASTGGGCRDVERVPEPSWVRDRCAALGLASEPACAIVLGAAWRGCRVTSEATARGD